MIARLRATDRANGFKSYYSPVTSHDRRNFVGPVGESGVASPRPETTESRETPPAFEDRRRTVIAPERSDIQFVRSPARPSRAAVRALSMARSHP